MHAHVQSALAATSRHFRTSAAARRNALPHVLHPRQTAICPLFLCKVCDSGCFDLVYRSLRSIYRERRDAVVFESAATAL